MASFTKFQSFVGKLGLGVYDLDADTLKIALTNSAPNVATADELADITQIANGNGYTTGGSTVPNTAYSQSGGTGTLVGDSVTFTGSGAGMATFRYAVLYDDTISGDPLIGYWDYGSGLTLNSGDTLEIKPNNSSSGGTILTVT